MGLIEENSYLKERLLEESDNKTLSEIFDLARTIEMTRENRQGIFAVRNQSQFQGENQHWKKSNRKSKCQSCGVFHFNNRCPAFNAVCNSCGNRGHYAKMCRKKRVQIQRMTTTQEEPSHSGKDNSEFFIGSVNADVSNHTNTSEFLIRSVNNPSNKAWTILVNVNNQLVDMCIDTGAQANVISLSELTKIGLPLCNIRPTNSKLTSYGGSNIPVVGQCILKCLINNTCLSTRFFVCKADQPAILGLESCQKFDLIRKIASISSESDHNFGSYSQMLKNYQDVFSGLARVPAGKMQDNLQKCVFVEDTLLLRTGNNLQSKQ